MESLSNSTSCKSFPTIATKPALSEARDPPPWDFSAALDLLHALTPKGPCPPSPPQILSTATPRSLGDFDRLFAALGLPLQAPSLITNLSEESQTVSEKDDDSTSLSSPPPDDIETETKPKEVRWIDEVDGTDIDDDYGSYVSSAIKFRNPRKRSPKSGITKSVSHKHKVSSDFYNSEFESELEPSRTLKSKLSSGSQNAKVNVDQDQLEAADLARRPWLLAPLPTITLNPNHIHPIDLSSEATKRRNLVRKLAEKYPEDVTHLEDQEELRETWMLGKNVRGNGIHVFVDCSNIMIGFYNALKRARGININTLVKQPPFSFNHLALILERGRRVARRILAGSTTTPWSESAVKYPPYLREAREYGYELNIMERVSKVKVRRAGGGNGYGTSGQSSGSEAPYVGPRVMTEQGVDELLHMKLLETLVDFKDPGTIVLASGDAAEAEYSGGFLKNVERALKQGWRVELVAWKDGLSKLYKSREFLQKWEGRFMIVELDDYSEELLAIYTNPVIS